MPRVRKIQRAVRRSSSRRFLSFIFAAILVFAGPYGWAQSSQAPGQAAATPSQPGAGLSPDSARLMQLLRTRPEMTGLLKGYLVQRMRMAGSTIDEKSVTDRDAVFPNPERSRFRQGCDKLAGQPRPGGRSGVAGAASRHRRADSRARACSSGISAECSGYNHGFRPGRNCFGDSFRSHRERERNCRFLEFVRTVLDCASSRRAKHCVRGAIAGDAEFSAEEFTAGSGGILDAAVSPEHFGSFLRRASRVRNSAADWQRYVRRIAPAAEPQQD